MAKSSPKKPRRTTLFFKYFRVTFTILLITTVALCGVFIIFMVNNWTTSNVDVLKRNVSSLVNDMLVLDSKNAFEENPDEARITLFIDFHTISNALGGDFFMTDTSGNVVVCKDLITDELRILHNTAKFCTRHGGTRLDEEILKKTTADGYYTMKNITEFGDEFSIIVGQKVVNARGETLGYIYGTMPVSASLGPYIKSMLQYFAGAAAVSVVLTIILVYLFSYKLTKPLSEMSRITKLYARGDFSQRLPINGNDELTDLSEKLNQMADSLEVLDDSRSAFVANVSHELKTPMTSIGGFIDGILDGTIPQSEEKKYLRIVSDEVKRLSSLVQTMLSLSKIEAGEEKLQPGKTEMKGLLFGALLNFEKQIEDAGIEVSGFEDMKECTVTADENMIYQVVYNLYDNAIKFTNDGGFIMVELIEESDRVTVTIANTGEGIKDEEMIHIFERFYKADKSRSEYVKGVGLGLNLAKNIVELHGGEISAVSTPGELTSFSFWIPKK
ncbi:MAG: HAMP domain-containing histidine kinase [Clostridia bacterium]|nr:HAMP domain-containing histidine kinase [Clostridia bacterium]MBR5991242.1 HAMP domain-containing histidine kinase [Clostridia bacterium]